MKRKRLNIFVVFCLTIMMITSLLPVTLFADQKTIYATSLDGNTYYYSIGDAWTASKSNTIVMQCDWNLKDRLVLNSNDVISIYMNGYTISRDLTSSKYDGEVIYMNAGSSLTLKGCGADGKNIIDKKFYVEGQDLSGVASDSLIGGGLVTGGYSSNGGGGVHMKKNAKLTLDNVIVGGNKANSDYGGGVNMNNIGSSLTLKNGAKIAYNVARLGGGIYVASSNCSISLSGGSTIEHNYAIKAGGGIYSYSNHTSVRLSESSSISYNIAKEDGGGYYGFYSFNTIESSDKTGLMNYNVANNGAGGAIFLESVMIGQNENSISGICFEGNTCNSSGGAIYLNQEWTTVRDCVIKNNKANGSYAGMGGGVYNINDHNTFSNCTITGNYATNSGGGIYQGLYNNILLKDKVIIKNNTRVEGVLDDLYLSNYVYSTAYIVSNPSVGSEVGIKIYDDGSDREIGENAEFDETMFFSDVKGYYIRYDSTEKKMYLARSTKDNASYSVTVNGKLQGYYNANAKLTIDGTSSDNRQVFKKWNGDVDALDSTTKVVASVSMEAKKDLSFTSEYVYKVSNFTLTVEKPVAGKSLPEEGTLSWTGDNKANKSLTVDIYWLVQNDDGNTQTASGIADYNTNYSVAAKIDADVSKDLVFADTVSGTVKYADIENTYKVYVDDALSILYMYGEQILTEKANINSVTEINVSIAKDSSVDDLIELLPTTAKVYDTKLNEYTINLDTTNADLSEVVIDDKINNNGGVVTIPLKLDGTEKVKNDNNLMLTVNVEVKAEGKLKAPSANYDSGTYNDKDADGKVTLNIKLTADEGAKIYYKINDGTYIDYNSDEGISIFAEEGQKKIYSITTYAGNKDNYYDSSSVTYTYVLDNVAKYTMTIKKMSEGVDIGAAYVATYDVGDLVTIGAPVISDYKFDSWTNEEGITITDDNRTNSILSIDGIQNNIVLTANYSLIKEPTYDYAIIYVAQNSDSLIELYRIESLAEDGADVTPLYVPSTIMDSDDNIYEYVSMDKYIVSKDSDNIFYVYYKKKDVKQEETPIKSYDLKDTNQDGIVDCSEEMNSNNWIWSNTKKACVYKVNNTSVK